MRWMRKICTSVVVSDGFETEKQQGEKQKRPYKKGIATVLHKLIYLDILKQKRPYKKGIAT